MSYSRPRGTVRTGEQVSYDVLKARVLAAIDAGVEVKYKSQAGQIMWPKHNMHAQGLAGAASWVLKRMEHDGLVKWHHGGFGTNSWRKLVRP